MSTLRWNERLLFGQPVIVTESSVNLPLDDFIYELRSAAARYTAPRIEIISQTDNPGEQDEMTSVAIVIRETP